MRYARIAAILGRCSKNGDTTSILATNGVSPKMVMLRTLTSLIFTARLYLLAAPFVCAYSGAAMNQAVLIANGGKFPVMLNERVVETEVFGKVDKGGYMDSIHCRMTRKTRLNWLADYINLKAVILSPGDILIYIGEYLSQFSTLVWMTLMISDRKQA